MRWCSRPLPSLRVGSDEAISPPLSSRGAHIPPRGDLAFEPQKTKGKLDMLKTRDCHAKRNYEARNDHLGEIATDY
ncbi:MAG TPA: hypothetical protein PKZ70_08685 [Candidatus Atribacteria bacterium]|nr:hypothetical protein [Candidatus Atribacteria bacterium]